MDNKIKKPKKRMEKRTRLNIIFACIIGFCLLLVLLVFLVDFTSSDDEIIDAEETLAGEISSDNTSELSEPAVDEDTTGSEMTEPEEESDEEEPDEEDTEGYEDDYEDTPQYSTSRPVYTPSVNTTRRPEPEPEPVPDDTTTADTTVPEPEPEPVPDDTTTADTTVPEPEPDTSSASAEPEPEPVVSDTGTEPAPTEDPSPVDEPVPADEAETEFN